MGGTRGKRVAGKKKPKAIKAKVTSKFSSKRRLSRMGKEMKKGQKGLVANFMTRSQVLRKLQITLKDFRRLCILKGIYPRDPKKKPSGKDKAYYHIKDVSYLAHEPLLNKFRDIKAFMKKVRKALSRGDVQLARARESQLPRYSLDHLVRERYPRFTDALADLDDALCLVHMFAALPADGSVKAERTEKCRRLALEWQYYCGRAHALSKVFVSIKGVYFQAEVQGQPITWIIPHQFTQVAPPDVDFRIMLTFLEFYETLLKFVLFKLYHQQDLVYPPALDGRLDECGVYVAAVRGKALTGDAPAAPMEEEADGEGRKGKGKKDKAPKKIPGLEKKLQELTGEEGAEEEDEEEELPEGAIAEGLGRALEEAMEGPDADVYKREREERAKATLFKGLRFFISREVPLSWMHFVMSSYGGLVGWEGEGSPFPETDRAITHQIVDRPALRGEPHAGREYVQPQWVLDSINAKALLPVDLYGVGKPLPPHLSPFVDDAKEGYVPAYREEIDQLTGKGPKQGEEEEGQAPEEEEVEEDEDGDEDEEGEEMEDDEEDEEEEEEEKAKAPAAPSKAQDKKAQRKMAKKSEEKELAKIMLPRKQQRAYRIAQQSKDKKREKVEDLMRKRKRIEEEQASKGPAPKAEGQAAAATAAEEGVKGKGGKKGGAPKAEQPKQSKKQRRQG